MDSFFAKNVMIKIKKSKYTEKEIRDLWTLSDYEDIEIDWNKLPLWEKVKWHILGPPTHANSIGPL